MNFASHLSVQLIVVGQRFRRTTHAILSERVEKQPTPADTRESAMSARVGFFRRKNRLRSYKNVDRSTSIAYSIRETDGGQLRFEPLYESLNGGTADTFVAPYLPSGEILRDTPVFYGQTEKNQVLVRRKFHRNTVAGRGESATVEPDRWANGVDQRLAVCLAADFGRYAMYFLRVISDFPGQFMDSRHTGPHQATGN